MAKIYYKNGTKEYNQYFDLNNVEAEMEDGRYK
jgi:hypothetical protein